MTKVHLIIPLTSSPWQPNIAARRVLKFNGKNRDYREWNGFKVSIFIEFFSRATIEFYSKHHGSSYRNEPNPVEDTLNFTFLRVIILHFSAQAAS